MKLMSMFPTGNICIYRVYVMKMHTYINIYLSFIYVDNTRCLTMVDLLGKESDKEIIIGLALAIQRIHTRSTCKEGTF